MAGDWIKMRCDLFTHPKVVRISSALRADTLRTVGGLMSVWCLFDAHSIDGNLEGYEPQTLDIHLRWDGFAEAMMLVKWLEYDPAIGLFLPSFDSHNGQSSKRRAQDADRKKDVRKMSASEADDLKTKSGLEKRREEKRNKDKNTATAVVQPEGLSDFVWADFKKLRLTKKAPLTQTALNGIQREASKAGIDLEQALSMCCERGWTGFKAEWLAEKPRGYLPPQPNETVPAKPGLDPTLAALIRDRINTKPPSSEIRAKLAALSERRAA